MCRILYFAGLIKFAFVKITSWWNKIQLNQTYMYVHLSVSLSVARHFLKL